MNLNSILVESINVIKTNTDSRRKVWVVPRCYHSLSYRIKGRNLLYEDNLKISSNAHSLTFVPRGKRYIHHIASPSEQIVVHFTTKGNIGDSIENFVLPLNCNMEYLFCSLYDHWKIEPRENNLDCMSVFYSILALIEKNITRKGDYKSNLIYDSVSYMHTHYRKADFNISSLYEQSYISPAYYRRIFNEIYGCSPIEYLKGLRINYAKQLLRSGYHTVAEVSELAGFSSPSYFSWEFKRLTGYTPSKY